MSFNAVTTWRACRRSRERRRHDPGGLSGEGVVAIPGLGVPNALQDHWSHGPKYGNTHGHDANRRTEAAEMPERSLIAAAETLVVRTQRGQWWLPVELRFGSGHFRDTRQMRD
jgi:hypothetical protein